MNTLITNPVTIICDLLDGSNANLLLQVNQAGSTQTMRRKQFQKFIVFLYGYLYLHQYLQLYILRAGAQSPEQTLLSPSDGRGGANFGNSISIHSNSMAVGAPSDNSQGFNAGAVFMFDYISADDTWSERTKLTASATSSGDKFGFTVNVYEDTLVVGAATKLRVISGDIAAEAGAVHIFLRTGNSWSESQQLVATGGQAYDHFGGSVSLYENTLLIGAADDDIDSSGISAGSVYLFSRTSNGANFQQVDAIHAADAVDRDKFGFAVDVYGAMAVVGAYQDDDFGSRSGSVYVYGITGSSLLFQQKITAFDSDSSDSNKGDAFGFSLSLIVDTLAVSAFYDSDAGSLSGAVYIYTRSSETTTPWTAQAKLSNNDVGSAGAFGYSVDLDAGEVVIGATGVNSEAGGAYVYQYTDNITGSGLWELKWTIVAADGQHDDSLGYAVGIEGTRVVVSSPTNDDNGLEDSDAPTSEPSLSLAPSSIPSPHPSAEPSTSSPTGAPVTSSPSAVPSTSVPSHFLPSAVPTRAPNVFDPSAFSSSSTSDLDLTLLYIVIAVIFGGVVLVFLSLKLCGIAKRQIEKKLESSLCPEPVVAEVYVLNAPVISPSNSLPNVNIASVASIEQVTPAPSPQKKKKKKLRNSTSTSTSANSTRSSNSVSAVLPFATHVSDHVPVAELELV